MKKNMVRIWLERRLPLLAGWIALTCAATKTQAQSGTVVGWSGTNLNSDVLQFPMGQSNVARVAAGTYASYFLLTNGTLQVQGGTRPYSTNLPTGLTNLVDIQAGNQHAVALRRDGSVIVWGDNSYQQLNVPPGLSNVVTIAAGYNHSLALTAYGTVTGWGYNSFGQATAPAGLSNVVAIAAGIDHSLAVTAGGQVVAWGSSSSGAATVPAGLSGIVAVAAGNQTSLALDTNGMVTAWGRNYTGGTTFLPPGLSNVVGLAANFMNSLAVRSDGSLMVWGGNAFPVTNPPPGLNQVVQATLGLSYGLALQESGPPWVFAPPGGATANAGVPATIGTGLGILGARPITYQWQFNGTNIPGATNANLKLLNVQPNQVGPYQLLIANRYGAVLSPGAVLNVLTNPPVFLLQPTNVLAGIGGSAVFQAQAGGPQPIFYQWQFGGTNLLGATNAQLLLPNFSPANQGVYTVVAANAYGSVTSTGALAGSIDLGTALNCPGLNWSSTSSIPWLAETSLSHDGVAAAEAVVFRTNIATLQTTVTTGGTISFWYEGLDSQQALEIEFWINGVKTYSQVPGDRVWYHETFVVPWGTNLLRWQLSNSQGLNVGTTGVVDQVTFTPDTSPPSVTNGIGTRTGPAGTPLSLAVGNTGAQPVSYAWQFNGLGLTGATNSSLVLSDPQAAHSGNYTVWLTNAYGWTFSTGTLTVVPAPPSFQQPPTNQTAVAAGICEFTGLAAGTEPLSYQWQFNGASIAGATSTHLVLGFLSAANLGNYTLAASNAAGVTVSPPATLTLVSNRFIGWGDDSFLELTPPAGTVTPSIFLAGDFASALVNPQGNLVTWGFPYPSLDATATNLLAVAARGHTLVALRADGTILTAGSPAPANATNCIAVATAVYYALGLRADGGVLNWPIAGTGDPNNLIATPLVATNVVAIAAGADHNLALRQDGVVLAWGLDYDGQIDIPANLRDVVAIAAGFYYSAAVRSDGTVVVWGGAPGSGITNIPPGLSNVVAIAAGDSQIIALRQNGSLVTWGASNLYSLPVTLTNVASFSMGAEHGLAVLNNGAPAIFRQPWTQTADNGDSATLTTVALGLPPLTYQWQYNGANVPAATNSSFVVPASWSTAGSYRCNISNDLGGVMTSPAQLFIRRTTPYFTTLAGGDTGAGEKFTLAGLSGHGPIIVSQSTNLHDWFPILTNPPVLGIWTTSLRGPSQGPAVFYRAAEQ